MYILYINTYWSPYLVPRDLKAKIVGVFLGHSVKGVVSKETVVLRRWGSFIQKFGFINGFALTKG